MSKIRQYILAGCLAFAGLLTGPASAVAQYSRIDNSTESTINGWFSDAIANDQLVGGAIGIVKDGEIVFLKGYGKADLANDVPADECTLFRMGSVSKLFTSTLAMQLWEEGKLDLNANVHEIVPEFPARPEGIMTPGFLISHRSGLPGQGILTSQYAQDNPSYNPFEAIEIFKNTPLDPSTVTIPLSNTGGVYSNFGFNLLGAVITRVAHAPYEQLVIDRLVIPSGMARFEPEYIWKQYDNRSKLYNTPSKTIIPDNQGKFLGNVPSGGHIATVADLALFARAFGNGSLLHPNTRTTMATTQTRLINKNNIRYGLGIQIDWIDGQVYAFHGGGIDGGAGIIYFSPDYSDAVVMLANSVESYSWMKGIASTTVQNIGGVVVSPGNLYQTGGIPQSAIQINADQSGNAIFQAHAIESNATMQNNSVIRLEGGVITLKPGFVAAAGTDFLAHVGNPNTDCALQQPNNKSSEIFAGNKETATIELALFPNPSTGWISLRASAPLDRIEIFDLYGRKVRDHAANQQREIKISLAGLPAGTWLARIHTQNREIIQKKVVLQP